LIAQYLFITLDSIAEMKDIPFDHIRFVVKAISAYTRTSYPFLFYPPSNQLRPRY